MLSVALAVFALQTAPPNDVAALVAKAREARYQQDSMLASYQVVVRQRMSGGIGVTRGLVGQIGRPRLAARMESVARVGWHHATGAWGEILAARSVVPVIGENDPTPEDEDAAIVLPYYPGRENLWPTGEMREVMPDHDDWIMHPLERGADSMYAFSLGDSVTLRLPDAATVTLREIRMRPRRPDAQLVVGSLWVDVATGALVRAAYRPSMAMDLWPFFGEEMDREDQDKVKKLGPFLGTVREVIVEHGLYQRRFWLPRTRIAHAEGTARIGRVTASIEQTFTYEKVAALAPGETNQYMSPRPDRDPRTGRIRRPQWRGVEETTRVYDPRYDNGNRGRWSGVQRRPRHCRPPGDSSATFTPDSLATDDRLTVMYAEGVRVRVLLPCRMNDLVTSPLLPPSVYDPSEQLFTQTDFNALRKDVEGALAIGSQAEWEPQPAKVYWGIDKEMLRYNRVEGLSFGARAERVFGAGYTGAAEGRFGIADLQPNAELSFARSSGTRDVEIAGYRRLAAANDWGEPLGLGASIQALLFATDDGFYYRTAGAELTGTQRSVIGTWPISWRVFGERHDSARLETHESLSRLISGTRFRPNIQALAGMYYGGSLGAGFAWGLDPRSARASGAIKLEGAGGETSFGRAMLDMTLARGLGERGLVSLTGAAGASLGDVPPQRLWYLGGAHTVRGHRAGSAAGDAFWLGRVELSRGHPLVRPTLFGDIGWAGSRDSIATPGRPMTGAGIGAAFLDGLVRIDVARGISAGGRLRADFYFEIR